MLSNELIIKALKTIQSELVASTACHGKNENFWSRVLCVGLEQVFNDPNILITVEQKDVYKKKVVNGKNKYFYPDLTITDHKTNQIKVVLEAKHVFSWDVLNKSRGDLWNKGKIKKGFIEDLDKLQTNLHKLIKKTAEVYFLLYIVHFHTVKAPKWFKYGEEHNKVVTGKNILGKRFNNPEDFLNAVKNKLEEDFGEFFTNLYEKSSPIDFRKYHGVSIQFIPILFPESKFDLIRNY